MRIFVVSRGDSLYSVSRRFGVSTARLAKINDLADPKQPAVGHALIIPEDTAPVETFEMNGCVYPDISGSVLTSALPLMTYLSPFAWRVNSAGELAAINDERLIAAAREYSTAPLLTVCNVDDSGGFSGTLSHRILTDPAVRERFVESIMAVIEERGYYGLNLALEYIFPYDKAAYNGLLRLLSERLHSAGRFLCTSVAPKTDDSRQGALCYAHDYAAHGRYCDRVVIMTYEWGHTYSAPRPVSPVDRIREVLSYAVTRIDPGKILMGFSDYGYNWQLSRSGENAASLISNRAAAQLASSVGAEIKYDPSSASSFFNYTDPSGIRREVRFEDARSIKARLSLVSEYSLAGISCFAPLGFGHGDLYVINSMFNAEKML